MTSYRYNVILIVDGTEERLNIETQYLVPKYQDIPGVPEASREKNRRLAILKEVAVRDIFKKAVDQSDLCRELYKKSVITLPFNSNIETFFDIEIECRILLSKNGKEDFRMKSRYTFGIRQTAQSFTR